MTQQPSSDDVLRIMVSTDNHLGVWERDEWRGRDSFEAFEEVFKEAKEAGVDMVLLGGDLFHDNKPSRSTLVKCLEILNRYCLSDDPVKFQVVSDPAEIVSGVDNTRSPTLNVGLPVFTIHGNHDDPSGVENLSAVDILSTIQYVNYFGKHSFGKESNGDSGRLNVKPLLIKKGKTKVALYGLGFLREERLARSFQLKGQVLWSRPVEDTSNWFNMFVLHQNRVQHHKTGPNNKARSIQDKFLPDWLDMVVWGHEHECKPSPEPASDESRNFSVLQPGSTVATALSEPESKPKACFILDICGELWRITRRPLRSARPFKWRAVSLKELGAEPGNHKQIEKLLSRVVEELIKESNDEQAAADSEGPLGESRPAPRLPIVRLRVDYTGYSTIHSQRFGQMFINRVANPQDIVLWSKSPERKPTIAGAAAKGAAPHMPEALDTNQMEDLIAEFAGNLEILPAKELGEALRRFVEKDEKHVLQQAYEAALKTTQDAVLKDITTVDATRPDDSTEVAEARGGDKDGMDVVERMHAAGKRLQAEANAKYADATASQDLRLKSVQDVGLNGTAEHADMDDDDAGPNRASMPPPAAKRGRGGRSAASWSGRKASAAAPASRGRSKAAAPAAKNTLHAFLSQPTGTSSRQTQRTAAKAAKAKVAEAGLESDDDGSVDMIEGDDAPLPNPTPTRSASEWSQPARKKSQGKPSQQSTAAMSAARTQNRGRRLCVGSSALVLLEPESL